MTRKSGFTLLELLVVMGIIAMMTGMGIYGLTRFQANTQVQTVANDVVTLLKTVQNNAKNSVSFVDQSSLNPDICSSNGNCVPDYYGISFSANRYDVYGCLDSAPNIVCPSQNNLNIQGLVYPDVTFSYVGNTCDYIAFQRLTGDIMDVQGNPIWTLSSNQSCTVRISNSYGDTRTLEINLSSNSIRDAGF